MRKVELGVGYNNFTYKDKYCIKIKVEESYNKPIFEVWEEFTNHGSYVSLHNVFRLIDELENEK